MRTAVAIGSNLGDRLKNLRIARQRIGDLADVQSPIVSSAIYETEPIDCEPGAAKFLNAVIEFDYGSDPIHLLEELIHVEESLGRRRDHAKNVSRTIDIDLLYCGDRQIDNKRLHLPHPRMHLRRFVLQPLADIRPDLILPDQTGTVADLLTELDPSSEVVRFTDRW
jgi:2-amino-4-hydroxy-6-hydroxymethyldihydropteridine diphosphokinase